MQVALIRVAPNGQTQRVPIDRPSTILGRNDECHIRIRSGGMSRKHCEILVEDGSVTVRDLGSSNGTFVNQDRIETIPVSAGDLVSVGGLVFLIEVDGDPEEVNAALLFEDGLPEVAEPVGTPKPSPSMVPAGDASDESSMMDFEFNLDDDDDDDQPPL